MSFGAHVSSSSLFEGDSVNGQERLNSLYRDDPQGAQTRAFLF